jgi:hypothetical protein
MHLSQLTEVPNKRYQNNYLSLFVTFLALMVHFAMQGFFTSFGCPYFVMYLSLGLIKVNPRLIASDDICDRSIVVRI